MSCRRVLNGFLRDVVPGQFGDGLSRTSLVDRLSAVVRDVVALGLNRRCAGLYGFGDDCYELCEHELGLASRV